MSYSIPLFDLNYDDREQQAVVATLQSKWISTGPRCAEFEQSFAKALGVEYALALSNCTVGLHLALVALGIGPGDEVIVPSLTFVATVNAVKYVGATPVFCDIEGVDSLVIDPVKAERLITARTKAVIVMHYGGFPCNMAGFQLLAEKHNLKIVEDACHAPLSDYGGKKLGTFGEFGCFSFFSNKNISTGEGGMLVTNDKALYEQAKLLRSHGMTSLSYERSKGHATSYDVVALGYNYRMDDIRAAIGCVQLAKLEADLLKRAEIRKKYIVAFAKIPQVIIPFKEHQSFVSNYIFPIVLESADEVRRDNVRIRLHEKGVQTSVHYPAVHRFSIYADTAAKLPLTESVADTLITLPMFGSLSDDQITYIASSLQEVLSHE